jgi:hypothetical protein
MDDLGAQLTPPRSPSSWTSGHTTDVERAATVALALDGAVDHNEQRALPARS